MMLEAFGVTEENWREASMLRSSGPAPPTSRSPSRLATSAAPSSRWPADPDRARWNQQSVTSGQLAVEYGFTDVDGSRPDVWRYMEERSASRASMPTSTTIASRRASDEFRGLWIVRHTETTPQETPHAEDHPQPLVQHQGGEAAEYYVSVFPNSGSRHDAVRQAGPGPDPCSRSTSSSTGRTYTADQRRPEVHLRRGGVGAGQLRDQAEIDHYWEKLTEGGDEGQCGWLKDKYGLSWQVVFRGWEEVNDTDQKRAQRAMTAMLGMRKLDLAALEAGADGARRVEGRDTVR